MWPLPSKSETVNGVARLLSFFVMLLVAIAAADRLVGAGLRSIETSSFGVFNRIVEGRINATVLVTGS